MFQVASGIVLEEGVKDKCFRIGVKDKCFRNRSEG